MTNLVPGAPSPFAELKEQATLAFKSGLLPRSVDSVEKAIIIALAGKELGLSPMQALSGIYVVNGMFALRGATMLRLIYERVPGAQITVLTKPEKSSTECEVEMQRPHGKAQRFRYTIQDAQRGGFASKPIWQQHTATMLRWAAIRTGARIVFADAIAGCYMEDEIEADGGAVRTEKIQAMIDAPPPETDAPPEILPPAEEEPYVVPLGQFQGKRLDEIDREALYAYCVSKREYAEKTKRRIGGQLRELLDRAEAHLAKEETP